MLGDVVDATSRDAALRARKAEERKLEAAVDAAMRRADPDAPPPGCGVCRLFRRRRARVALDEGTGKAAAAAPSAAGTGMAGRLFGRMGQKGTDKLGAALAGMQARADALSERHGASHRRVMALKAAGKKAEAVQELKRMKALEKQLATARAAAAAIERQVDIMEESALQKEVATALSASVKAAKAKGKGVLSAAETAVEGAAEVRDLAEDLQQVMGELAPDGLVDDDELLAELEEMAETGAEATQSDAIAEAKAAASVEPQTATKAVELESDPVLVFPQAPQTAVAPKREERMKLLASV